MSHNREPSILLKDPSEQNGSMRNNYNILHKVIYTSTHG